MPFNGDVITKWLSNSGPDRYMKLMEDFSYTDKSNNTWITPKGHIVDGASIPSQVWSIVGSPYVGDYRRASVIHDYECVVKLSPHKEVHKRFYNAMLEDGVSKIKAKIMYRAVRIFGPKWNLNKTSLVSNLSGVLEVDESFLFHDLDLDIDELESKLDNMLGE